MSSKQNQIQLLIYLVVLFFIVNFIFFYPELDKSTKNFFSEQDVGFVERVIDGDTIEINGTSVRLLGINCPEKREKFYSEAKSFLEDLVLNKTVRLEYGKNKYDRYQRILAYVFVSGKNVNLEIVKNGFANFYFPSGKDVYYNDFYDAWERCVKDGKNFCAGSEDKCANCIELKKFDYKNQEVIFSNKCDFECDLTGWEIKDEGRKKFIFPDFVLKDEVEINVGEGENNGDVLFWKGEDYVWTNTGDTIFLRDETGKLVLWWSY